MKLCVGKTNGLFINNWIKSIVLFENDNKRALLARLMHGVYTRHGHMFADAV